MGTWYRLEDGPSRVSEKSPEKQLRYIVTGVVSDSEIDTEVRSNANTPSSVLGLSRLDYDDEPKGGGVFYVTVKYGIPTTQNPELSDTGIEDQIANNPQPPSPPELGGVGNDANPPNEDAGESQTGNDSQALGSQYSFDTTGGTAHITQSLSTVASYGVGVADVPDYKQAINVTKEGVGGVDIGKGSLRFTYTGNFPFVTRKYFRTLRDLTYTVNDATFFGFAAGEVLFTGASGNYEAGKSPWKITFNFEVSPNQTNIVIFGDVGTPATSLIVSAKKGHEYLWCSYKDVIAAGEFTARPVAAYVEQVYESKSLKKLGI
jgi:hypothetical protein